MQTPAKLTCSAGVFKHILLLNDAIDHNTLTYKYAECSENVSMEMQGWQGRRQQGRL